jgi:hypothetical protein
MIPSVSENKASAGIVLLRALLFICCCALALAVAARYTRNLYGRWPEFAVGVICSLWAFGLTSAFAWWDGVRLEEVGAAPDRRSLIRLIFGFLIGTALVTLWLSMSALTGHVHWIRVPENGAATAAITLSAYLALAWREELAFHGYPLRRLQQPFGVWGAQLIVAAVFALEHMVGGWTWMRALFGAGVGSILFGMAAIATRGLAVPIGLHAAWNFWQSSMGLNGEPALWRVVVDQGEEQPVDQVRTLSYVVIMGSATFAFWLWYRRTNRPALPD